MYNFVNTRIKMNRYTNLQSAKQTCIKSI